MISIKKTMVLTLLLLSIGAQGQSLADNELERFAEELLYEESLSGSENSIRYIGVVVTDVATNAVLADVCLFNSEGIFSRVQTGNTLAVPSGLGRSVLYLAMMPETSPFIVLDTRNGRYLDSSGYVIEDFNHSRGGFGFIDLKRAYSRNSDVGILMAAELVFGKDLNRLTAAIERTGINFQMDYGSTWQSTSVLGHNTMMSLLQQVSWCNAVAGGKGEGLDSLRSAMRETVTDGMGRRMDSEYTSVAGFTYSTPHPDADGYKGAFAAAFFPYEEPKYTVGFYVTRRAQSGVFIPSKVVRKVIDWMAIHKLGVQPVLSSGNDNDGRIHPAAR